jgi:glycosyltransferase involved in cell wall biosynthesis
MEIFINYQFPDSKASAIQAVRVAQAFAGAGAQTTFFYRGGVMSRTDWAAIYGVVPRFRPRRYPGLYVGGHRVPLINDAVTRAVFAGKVLRGADGRCPRILYGRNPGGFPMGFFLTLRRRLGRRRPLVVCEAHEGKDWAGTALTHADVVVAISEGVKRDLRAAGITEEKIVVAHDGVDLAAYDTLRRTPKRALRQALGLPPDEPLAVFTGHLYPDRGAGTIVEALTHLPALKAVFVGGRPEDRERVRRAVVKARVEDRVLFVEERPPSEIPPYQIAGDILLMPYNGHLATRAWCSPLKLFEYMAAGVPIVASDLPVFHEVAEGDREIVYVPPDDGSALATAMARLLSDRDLAGRIAGNAVRRVRGYDWEHRAKVILEFCRSRLAPAGPG